MQFLVLANNYQFNITFYGIAPVKWKLLTKRIIAIHLVGYS